MVLFKAKEVHSKTIPLKRKITCKAGHVFYKSADCSVCPKCEASSKPNDDFLSHFAAPARRALMTNNITTFAELKRVKPESLEKMHGIGPVALKIIRTMLKEKKRLRS